MHYLHVTMSTYVFSNTGESVFPSIIGSVSSCTVPSNLLTLSSNYGLPISFTDPNGKVHALILRYALRNV
jgi:hypothetical protein